MPRGRTAVAREHSETAWREHASPWRAHRGGEAPRRTRRSTRDLSRTMDFEDVELLNSHVTTRNTWQSRVTDLEAFLASRGRGGDGWGDGAAPEEAGELQE